MKFHIKGSIAEMFLYHFVVIKSVVVWVEERLHSCQARHGVSELDCDDNSKDDDDDEEDADNETDDEGKMLVGVGGSCAHWSAGHSAGCHS